jgi:CBS domain-containing protein
MQQLMDGRVLRMSEKTQLVGLCDPACCRPHTMLDQVAKTMVQYDCGEIPVLDITGRPIGVVTDREIVCRVVAERKKSDGAS